LKKIYGFFKGKDKGGENDVHDDHDEASVPIKIEEDTTKKEKGIRDESVKSNEKASMFIQPRSQIYY
jgi:hypothetical protein